MFESSVQQQPKKPLADRSGRYVAACVVAVAAFGLAGWLYSTHRDDAAFEATKERNRRQLAHYDAILSATRGLEGCEQRHDCESAHARLDAALPPIQPGTTPQSGAAAELPHRAATLDELAVVRAEVTLEGVKNELVGEYWTVKGKVRNNSSRPVSFVKIEVLSFGRAGKVVDTSFTYAVGSDFLKPGAAKSWNVMIPYDDGAQTFKCRVASLRAGKS